jgi:Lon protease-like protein
MADEFLYIPQTVPVFPLPEVVLFPRTILPLHIFEPRYREMMQDALLGDRVISVALLKPNYAPLYYTHRAPIHPVVGVGQIVESEEAENGDFNLLLRGIGRARILGESTDRSYRIAHVEPIETYTTATDEQSATLRQELFAAIRGNPALNAEVRQHWLKLAKVEVGLDELTDLIAAGVPVEAEVRQCLLVEADASSRTRMLVEQITTLAAMARLSRRVPGPDEYNFN